MTERVRPDHKAFLYRKGTSNQTVRCFYINRECCYAFLVDDEKDINKILDKFFIDKDFISLKEYRAPEWDHIGLVDYFPETNEIFLSTDKKLKNLINSAISSKVLTAQNKKRLAEEQKIKDAENERKWQEESAKEKAKAAEKEAKRIAKFDREAKKRLKLQNKKQKSISRELKEIKAVRQDVQEIADVIKDIEEVNSPVIVKKTSTRSLI